MHRLGSTSDKTFLFWAAGSMLFAHMIAFMGVSYFGQMFLTWILTLVIISTFSDLTEKQNDAPKPVLAAFS